MAHEMDRPLGSQYRLTEQIGRGASGEVYRGVDTAGNEFACKVLRPDLTTDPAVVNRFMQERTILVGLQHPNLVGVHDLVAEGDTIAIVMDLVPGGDLRGTLAQAGVLLPAEAALGAIHAAGVVHRDIKPENVLMDDSDAPPRPRVTDLGVSRLLEQAASRSTAQVGTPYYMAPELFTGMAPSPAADLYALGIVLYELLCGVTPFAGAPAAVMHGHTQMWPGRPSGIPDPLWDLINWLTAKTPRARPGSAAEVAAILDELITGLRGVPLATRLSAPPPPVPTSQAQETQGVGGWVPQPSAATPGVVLPDGFSLPAPPKQRTRHPARRVAATLAVIAVALAAVVAIHRGGGKTPAADPSTPGTVSTTDGGTPPGPTTDPATTTTDPATTAPAGGPAPNFVGQQYESAVQAAPAGLTLQAVNTVDEKDADGTILSQNPKAGAPVLNGTIQVTVARQPVVTYLDSLPTVSGQWTSADTTELSGKTYAHALVNDQQFYCADESNASGDAVEYNLSRGYRRLEAVVGIDDNAQDSAVKVRVEAFVDGRPAGTVTAQYGKPATLKVDVAGGLRLKLQWVAVAGTCYSGTDSLAFGEAKLLGLLGEVPEPTDASTDGTDSTTG
jgi:hypothetical protein